MRLRTFLFASSLAVAGASTPAAAVSFNLVDTGGTSAGTEARLGFEIATRYWSSVLTDDITLTLNIGYQSLDPGVVGQTQSAVAVLDYGSVYEVLDLDRTSALDDTAVANLQPLTPSTDTVFEGVDSLSFVANVVNRSKTGYRDDGTRIDNDGGINNVVMAVNVANAGALGYGSDVNGNAIDYSAAAAAVYFSSDFKFDFDPTDGIAAGSLDFIGVAIHEIGHALGFTSGVDVYDAYTYPGNDLYRTTGALEGYAINTPLDLYRYSAPGTLDYSTSASDKYFSIDGGKTQVFGDSQFSTGTYNGDRQQASHWKDNAVGEDPDGILDPNVTRGTMMEVTALDLAAYDAIGWDLSFDVLANQDYKFTTADAYRMFGVVPEPATWMQMLLGFGLLAGATRRARVRRVLA